MNKEEKKKVSVAFSAINPYIEDNIVHPDEKEIQGKSFIEWGTRNKYPQYLDELYTQVPTLQSIINGTKDYVVGDGVQCNYLPWGKYVNRQRHTAELIATQCAYDYLKYGGFAINVIRDKSGRVCEIYPLNFKNLRSDKHNKMFYYSNSWDKSYGRVKYTEYAAFDPTAVNVGSSVFYFKSDGLFNTYPTPRWSSATKSAEIMREVTNFHLNNIKNGLTSNVMISFCSGVPDDETKSEIEEMISEKYSGSENAGRPMLNFCSDKEHAIDVSKLDVDNFSDRYKTIVEWSQQELYTAFSAVPCLFGKTDDNKGFAQQEYADAFALYNKTRVQPIQKDICDAFDYITGQEGSLTIMPFTIQFTDNKTEKTEIE